MAKKPKEAEKPAADEEAAEAAAPAPKRKLPVKLIVISFAGLLLVGGGAYAAMSVFGGHAEPKSAAPVVKPAVFVDLPEVLVNLSNTGNDRTQYLKVRMTLELPDAQLMTQIQPLMPRVMDTFQTYLRELRPSDLDGSAGLYRLREELTRRVNAAIAPNKVTALLFKEIVIQ